MRGANDCEKEGDPMELLLSPMRGANSTDKSIFNDGVLLSPMRGANKCQGEDEL